METAVTIRLDHELLRLIDEEAARAKVSRSSYIREILRGSLHQRRASAYDGLARYAGIIEGPRDLSTNPKHLKGIGRKASRLRK